MIRRVSALSALFLAACSSAPPHYYTLISPPTTTATATRTTPAPFQFQLVSVRIPVQTDQPQLVVRQGQGELAILENERWSAPLADEFSGALGDQLEHQLGIRNLANMPKDNVRPLLSMQIDVRRFESLPGNYVLIDVMWSLSQRDGNQQRRSLTCSTRLEKPAGNSLNDTVAAHQQLIAQLAQTMAGTARRWASQPTTPCP
ncbi:PqiC family protein [Pseudomonas sp. App30]|uniref:PqiC family protein n=1 Tax=Pseudomonas sp. App30 TaxID=3068990 RepID=UPI003A800E5C